MANKDNQVQQVRRPSIALVKARFARLLPGQAKQLPPAKRAKIGWYAATLTIRRYRLERR